MTSDPDPFRFRHPVTVRFRDIDVGGHAHHAEALVYFEEARWAYWVEVLGPGAHEKVTYVLAEATVRWHARIFWPQSLSVGVRTVAVGRKHFELEYDARSPEGMRLASGRSVQVMYDYQAARSVPMPPELAGALTEYDGPFGV